MVRYRYIYIYMYWHGPWAPIQNNQRVQRCPTDHLLHLDQSPLHLPLKDGLLLRTGFLVVGLRGDVERPFWG